MRAFLSNDVHFAWIDDDIVALDVRNDAYLCLVGAASVIVDDDDGRLVLGGPEVFDLFAAAGLAQAAPTTVSRRRALAAQTAVAPFDVAGSWAGFGFLISAVLSSRRYHGRPFSDLVNRARRMKRPTPAPPTGDLIAMVSAYRSGLPWTPRQEVCLHRSFMLLHYLRGLGVSADWVFGVRTWPFAAHCWLQIGDTVVGDDLHRVARYTPILVV
nr:lasso peptide biosynthesis B2 protein [uncultured Brevundimonas sp.]